MHTRRQSRSRRGSILIAMLGLVAILSAMLVSFMSEATERMKYNGLLESRTDLRPTAYSALEVALSVISEVGEIDNGLHSTAQGWGNPLEYAGITFPDGYDVKIEFADESSRLPLSRMGNADIQALLYELNVPDRKAQDLANTLLDWMDKDDMARLGSMDGADYRDEDPPYWSGNEVPQTWDEFRLIDGWKDFFWDKDGKATPELAAFKEAVSLTNTGKVNINRADPLVLAVLARMGGVDEQTIDQDLAGFDGVRGTADDHIVYDDKDPDAAWMQNLPLITNKIDLLRVKVTVTYGDATFMLDALVKYKNANPGAGSTNAAPTMANSGWDLFPKDPASATGYPFKVVQLVENQRN